MALGADCLQAQTFDATNLRKPTDLAAGWLVHAGDDPAYARADFDDSKWVPFNAQTDDLQSQPFSHSRPKVLWYRLHVKLAADQRDMALQEYALANAFEIYTNGVLLFRAGSVVPYVRYSTLGRLLIPIPDGQVATGSLVIALRIYVEPLRWKFPLPGFQSFQLTFGQMGAMREHMWFHIYGDSVLSWLDDLVTLGMMCGALLLYSTQRDRPEYLWLFLWVAATIPSTVLQLYELLHTFPYSWHFIDVLYSVVPYFVGRTYCAFAGHRVGWKLTSYLVLTGFLLAYAYLSFIGMLDNEGPFYGYLIGYAARSVLEMVILPVILIAEIRRGNRETGLLLIPLIIAGIWKAGFAILFVLSQVPASRNWAFGYLGSWSEVDFGPLSISYQTVADILSFFSLALIILIRSNQISRKQAVLEGEIANARAIQQVILPEAVETVPGFRIESVYEPAREVGGDFFQILPVGEGGMLVVVGDVAGKGLPAAMLVSVLVGAIRMVADYSHDPAVVLAGLNQRLVGRTHGGFSTALAAYIAADGLVTVANAGHLSPYLDGREVEMQGALPLGIVSGSAYESTRFHLANGSRLTFYSDGVVEAQSQKGELFGFDRAKDISTQSAAAIAEAAKQFGQEDDITVVTIERLAVVEGSTVVECSPILVPA
jgi:hypothetical protein